MGFLPWEIWVAFPGRVSCDRVTLPNPRCMLGVLVFSIIQRTLTWTTGSLTSLKCAQMLMHATAHRGVLTHIRESALKVNSGRKSLPALGNRTCVSSMTVGCSTNELHHHHKIISLCVPASSWKKLFSILPSLIVGGNSTTDCTTCPEMCYNVMSVQRGYHWTEKRLQVWRGRRGIWIMTGGIQRWWK